MDRGEEHSEEEAGEGEGLDADSYAVVRGHEGGEQGEGYCDGCAGDSGE